MKKQKETITNNHFITKKHFDSKMKNVDRRFERLMYGINLRFDYMEERLKKLDSVDERLDKIMNTLDWLVGRYKKFDEEHVILTGRYGKINEKLHSHETRITVLEKKSAYKTS